MQLSSIAILLLFCCTCLSGSKAECNCPEGWQNFKKSCYLFTKEAKHYQAAETYCQSKQANLVNIKDSDEEDFIRNYMFTLGTHGNFWIGRGYGEQSRNGEYTLYEKMSCLKFTYQVRADNTLPSVCETLKHQAICVFNCTV